MGRVLKADPGGIAKAADLLASGALVAFPTETVYGLGADARNGAAVARIFEAKGRPSFNPLIVHVAEMADVEALTILPEEARALLEDGWPPGLTLVLRLRAEAGLSPLVTAGLPTVGIRVPTAPTAMALLRAFQGPVAAPSANPSGKLSPTQAGHVLQGLGDKISAVIDDGPTEAGVESTILGFPGPIVLREGAYLVPDDWARGGDGSAPTAPGQLLSHYAPRGLVRLNATVAQPGEWHIGFGPVIGDVTLSASGDLAEAAAQLFSVLHDADARGVQRIAIAPVPDTDLGRAINDRLRRAAYARDETT